MIGKLCVAKMRRRGLLYALTSGLVATSGCISGVETPSLGGGPDRPPLAREDFVESETVGKRDAVMPNVSLLPVSTAAVAEDDGRVVQPPKSGDAETATGSNETTNASTGTTGATTTTTEVPVEAPNRDFGEEGLYVTDEFWRHRTHVHRYAVDGVTTTVYPTKPSSTTSVKVVVAASAYPRGGLLDSAESEPFRPGTEARQVTVPMDLSPAPEAVPLQYVVAVVPESVDATGIAADDLYALMETDPFVVRDGSVERTRPEAPLGAASGDAFERQPVEGGYVQTIRGRTNGRSWAVSYLAFESAYAAATRRSRGRARAEYVSFELLEGAANEIAEFLYEAAENNGFTSAFERIQFALSFV